MIITDAGSGWDSKVNFTDGNDVFVGYDMSQDCCEQFGWYITDCIDLDINLSEGKQPDTEGYLFDTTFFEELSGDGYDVESYAVFKLVKDGCCDLYLLLFNHHNGYYSHGFSATIGGEVWKEGYL